MAETQKGVYERVSSGEAVVCRVEWFTLRDISSSVASDLVRRKRFTTD